MEAFLGLVIGILVTMALVTLVKHVKSKQVRHSQSIILLDKIQKVCKFITVEGDFAEIYHYEDVKEKFLKLISSRKKALVVINAKAYVGFDFSKVKLRADENNKKIILQEFPQPEVLSIETNLNYYDKKDGMFNKFDASDLTGLHNDAKQHILEKVPESGLFAIAQKEALDAILMMETMVQTIGWKLDYSTLKIDKKDQAIIDKQL
ncbi:DUF4230 domain-containing protein [Mangrovimonas sp. AS39]|uniref:DUF4230 domain-containing protein n=1 Tax=Mangrovimonas futianensis TaxID=2895523 RepID=UPI001E39234D|nr:DUF4230 domain-containing protein [Mangrovimonas futianensis]MCF1190958.1 DUF4230 domain-containing protein [Mangrovimonas futianensis]MCF1194654.1 DUF4230 domain-containing protein [Mangrovimonas futianensis]